jgi:hypothetical protein
MKCTSWENVVVGLGFLGKKIAPAILRFLDFRVEVNTASVLFADPPINLGTSGVMCSSVEHLRPCWDRPDI